MCDKPLEVVGRSGALPAGELMERKSKIQDTAWQMVAERLVSLVKKVRNLCISVAK
jgi:hypothetical protein